MCIYIILKHIDKYKNKTSYVIKLVNLYVYIYIIRVYNCIMPKYTIIFPFYLLQFGSHKFRKPENLNMPGINVVQGGVQSNNSLL
jgi:hypothetical protein